MLKNSIHIKSCINSNRFIYTNSLKFKEIKPALKLKGKKKSSQDWVLRQLADPYVKWAKVDQYRCRSAYKLLEINEKHKILLPGMCVVDCGASPGSWSQVLVKSCNSLGEDNKQPIGTVISVDLNNISPIDGAIIFEKHDFTSIETQLKIKEIIEKHGGADAIVSDMAPLASGVKSLDHEVIIKLVYSAVKFSLNVLKPGGLFLAKVWDGGLFNTLKTDISKFYTEIKIYKPPASRSDSAENYIIAKNFKGLKKS